MDASATSGFGVGDIRGVTMDMQDHVTERIADGRIRIGRGVTEEPNYLVVGMLVGSSLMRVNGAKCNEYGGIHRNDIVQ